MNVKIEEYRAITITLEKSDEGPIAVVEDPYFGKQGRLPAGPNWVSDFTLMLNKKGVQVVGRAYGPNYSVILLTNNFETEL